MIPVEPLTTSISPTIKDNDMTAVADAPVTIGPHIKSKKEKRPKSLKISGKQRRRIRKMIEFAYNEGCHYNFTEGDDDRISVTVTDNYCKQFKIKKRFCSLTFAGLVRSVKVKTIECPGFTV